MLKLLRQFKMQISTQTDNQNYRKNVATNENCILRKMGLKLQKPSFKILCKITFWNKANWLNNKLIIWIGLPREKGSLFGGTA